MGKRTYVLFLLSLILVVSNIAITWAAESPSGLIVVRASDNSLWKATCSGNPQACTGFTSFPGMFASTPTVYWDEQMHSYYVWGRATDGSIWKASFDRFGTFNYNWAVVPGNTPSQIGAAGSNLSYPAMPSNLLQTGGIDVSTLSTNCNSMTALGATALQPPSDGHINISASGIYAPGIANKWVRVCISHSGGGCESLGPYLESSSVGPQYEGERRFALHFIDAVAANTEYGWWLLACREEGATGTLYWDDVIAIFAK